MEVETSSGGRGGASETVAFLFSDLVGSTGLLADLGADTYGRVLSAYRRLVEVAANEHDGEVVDREGDGIFLVFSTAAGAVRAAADAQRSLSEVDWPEGAAVAARMGVHVGEARRHEDGWVGLDIHRAARVGGAAHGGQVLVSEAARGLSADAIEVDDLGLRELGEHRLEGLERSTQLYQLVGPGLAEEFPALRTLEGVANNLPVQPTSFVGRERELGEVVDLVGDERLVTLVGVGGSGKTRLALEAAARLVTGFPDGVWLVELAAVTDGEAVAREVAAALGIREREGGGEGAIEAQLVTHLTDRQLLLVVDNCEHLLAAVAGLADRLLRSCPDLHVLATSREGLGIAGEVAWQVPSLALPEADEQTAAVEAADAVRLFVERARTAVPSFVLDDATRGLVVRICRRLDGIPLAIELAAARVRVLGLEGLVDRLADRFRVLTGGSRAALPRQQTLAATIDWSYQLLDEAERLLFERLSVFAGSFTLEAVEAVCAGGGIDELDVLDLLTGLVDKSMVTVVETDSTAVRYRLLETLRVYARDRLADTGDADRVRRRHRDHYLEIAADIEENLLSGLLSRGPQLDRIGVERDNLQAALDWSHDAGDRVQATHLAYVLASYWWAEGYDRRTTSLLRGALEGTELDTEWEAELRGRLGWALFYGDHAAGFDEIERAYSLLADAEPSPAKAWTLGTYAYAIMFSVDREARDAVAPAREALEVARAVGDRPTEMRVLITVGHVLPWAGEVEEGATYLREALAVARELDDDEAILDAYTTLLYILEFCARRGEEARRLTDEVLEWFEATGGRSWYGLDLGFHMALTLVFMRTGEWGRVEGSLEAMAGYHLEGFMEGWFRRMRGALRWMRGHLDEAHEEYVALRELDLRRWDEALYPVRAEIAALRGDLDTVRRLADEYLAPEVAASEQGLKIAVLRPLVHAEVDAALASTGPERDEHIRRARGALQQMHDIAERFPPPKPIQFELPPTSIAIAEAELSRATGPDPDLWRTAHDAAYHRYWQLYCRWRLAEALLAVGEHDEGEAVLHDTHQEVTEIGAGLIRTRLEHLARETDIADSALRAPPG